MKEEKKPMKFRFLYTNGESTFELHWLIHNGTDVYCGVPGNLLKITYHQSGKRHSVLAGERTIYEPHVPLSEIKGQFHLNTFGFPNNPVGIESSSFHRYTGKKSDALLSIDGRSIPAGTFVNVSLGLLEVGKMEILDRWASGSIGDPEWKIRRVMVVTDVKPWIYALIFW